MKSKLLFVQQAIKMDCLSQSTFNRFLESLSCENIPENIRELLVEHGFLTEDQATYIEQSISSSSQDNVGSISITFSDGGLVDVPLPDSQEQNFLPGSNLESHDNPHISIDNPQISISSSDLRISSSDFTPEATGEQVQEQVQDQEFAALLDSNIDPIDQTASIDQVTEAALAIEDDDSYFSPVPKGDSYFSAISINGGSSSLDDTSAATESTADQESSSLQTADGVEDDDSLSVYANVDKDIATGKLSEQQYQQKISNAFDNEEGSSSAQESTDNALARAAVQKQLISIEDLQHCLAERQKLSQAGQNISLRDLLISKNLLNQSEVNSILHEPRTQQLQVVGVEEQLINGKYRIIEELGSGGMGAVYKAEHTLLQHHKFFALKVMHPHFATKESSYKRFVREVEVAMGLVHRNIVAIREFGLLRNKSPYLVMDFSNGITLEDLLKKDWQRDMQRSINITKQILSGLQEAHQCNVVHRDLKPANLLVEKTDRGEDLVKIVDFGLAKLVEENAESLTQGVVGTPLYMSPEQASAESIDLRSDLYSLGLILYEMIVGKLPFRGKSIGQMLVKQISEAPTPPRELRPEVPIALERIILKAIAKSADKRYQTAEEFSEALEQWQATGKTELPLPDAEKPQKKRSRLWVAVPLLIIIAVGIIGGAIAFGKLDIHKLLDSLAKAGKAIAVTDSTDEQQYNAAMDLADTALEDKDYATAIATLKAYQSKYPQSSYGALVQKRLAAVIREQKMVMRQQKQEARSKYLQAKNRILAMEAQKLWKDAYVAVLDLEKIEALGDVEREELQGLRKRVEQQLSAQREYEALKDEVQREQDRGSYQQALSLLKTYLAKYPTSEYQENIRRKIDLLKDMEQRQRRQQYQQLLEDARLFIDDQDYRKAIAKLQKALKINADKKTYELLGTAYLGRKDYDNACKYLELASTSNGTTLKKLAQIYAKKGLWQKATITMKKALPAMLNESPQNKQSIISGYYFLNRLYKKRKKRKQFIAYYRKLIKYIKANNLVGNRYAKYYRELGLMLYRFKSYREEAATYLKTYRSLGGEDPRTLAILIQLTDFTPLKFRKKWKYLITVGSRKLYKTYELAAIRGDNQFLVKINGKIEETWYRQGKYFVKQVGNSRDKVLQYPVKLNASWQSTPGSQVWEYKVVSIEQTVNAVGKIFPHCIKILARKQGDHDRWSHFYYAADIGEVKQVILKNNRVIFEKELVQYN